MNYESWADVKGYEGIYKVSRDGIVYSCLRWVPYRNSQKGKPVGGVILTRSFDKDGYVTYSLTKDARNTTTRAHRVVAMAYLENPDNLPVINHKNGLKDDNRVENLEWCTVSHNVAHSFRELGRINPATKLTPEKRAMLIELLTYSRKLGLTATKEPFPLKWVAKCFKVHEETIRRMEGYPSVISIKGKPMEGA